MNKHSSPFFFDQTWNPIEFCSDGHQERWTSFFFFLGPIEQMEIQDCYQILTPLRNVANKPETKWIVEEPFFFFFFWKFKYSIKMLLLSKDKIFLRYFS